MKAPKKTTANLSLLFLVLFISTAPAQLISIKTVPIATGDQFMIFPSQNLGMGNISIALDDHWLDPFINPAKGAGLTQNYLFSSPTFYHITNNNGSVKTLPMGVLYKSSDWFGGAAISIQQLEPSQQNRPFWAGTQKLGDKYSDNMYLFGSLGRTLPDSKTSVGASFFWAGLDAVEGVEMLYSTSQDIQQYGNLFDLRIGLTHNFENQGFFELIFLYNRYKMTHEVFYPDWIINDFVINTRRLEKNLDKSNTWGLHLGYKKPISKSNWQVGGIATGNWKSHPKIPNYELMNIPRDPGNSYAYNLGVGFANVLEDTVIGFEVIYEPIWSNTWADAADQMTSQSGRIISAGSKTIENDFTFSNLLLRLGISINSKPVGFQLGLQMKSYRYLLDQYDYIQEFRRKQKEHWNEWTISWGLIMDLKNFRLRYTGRLINGTGRPGVVRDNTINATADSRALNILLAPSGALTLDDSRVFIHQFTIAVPLK